MSTALDLLFGEEARLEDRAEARRAAALEHCWPRRLVARTAGPVVSLAAVQALANRMPSGTPFGHKAPERDEPLACDYKRHGTTSLFAALDVKAGTIISKCMPRHRAQQFRRFLDTVENNVPADLDIHVIMDNASSHKTKLIRAWFAKRPRWHAHFTLISSSWINQVERFFALFGPTVYELADAVTPAHARLHPRSFYRLHGAECRLDRLQAVAR